MTESASSKPSRKQHILETLAFMLEANPGDRISIAALAKSVGVSEAALYRHFPSKTRMLEGLIAFAEDAIFSRINSIANETLCGADKLERICYVYLIFCERNPGITRLLTGDAITGETERLHTRIRQLFDRLSTSLRQILLKAELEEGLHLALSVSDSIQLIQACSEGLVTAFVRSQFKTHPSQHWPEQFPALWRGIITKH